MRTERSTPATKSRTAQFTTLRTSGGPVVKIVVKIRNTCLTSLVCQIWRERSSTPPNRALFLQWYEGNWARRRNDTTVKVTTQGNRCCLKVAYQDLHRAKRPRPELQTRSSRTTKLLPQKRRWTGRLLVLATFRRRHPSYGRTELP